VAYKNQGGDHAALFGIYILGLMKYRWNGRSPAERLDHIRQHYNLRLTVSAECKPALAMVDALFKYDIAEEMKNIAKEKLGPSDRDALILDFDSGLRIKNLETKAATVVRYSNSGPGFTVTGAAYRQEELDFMFALAGDIMQRAIQRVKDKKGDFTFELRDFAPHIGKLRLEDAL